MQDIMAALEKKRLEVGELRNAVQRLAQAELELSILENAFKILKGEALTSPSGKVGPKLLMREQKVGRAADLTSGSMTWHGREVLRKEGNPLHANILVERVNQAGKLVKKSALVSAIIRLEKAGKVFCRVKGRPNTFGLLEWQE